MTGFRSSILIRVGAAAGLALLAGCAGGNGPGPSTAPVAATTPPAGTPGWVDGDYQGTRSPDVGNPDCGFETAVGYDVGGGTIRLRTRKQGRALSGTIDPSGGFTLTSADGQPQVVGVIRGSRLTATETRPPHHHRHSGGEAVPSGVCTARIVATRVADTP